MRTLRILLVGDFRHREFHDATAWLSAHAEVEREPLLARATTRLRDTQRPIHLLVIAQSRPGQFSLAAIEQLHRAAPLARLVALLGSWCEGEARSGRPWPGVLRVYWHQWPGRLANEFAELEAGQPTIWAAPRTASDADLFLRVSDERRPPDRGFVAIRARQRDSFDGLADACHAQGFASGWISPRSTIVLHGATAAIWDGRGTTAAEMDELHSLAENLTPTPVVALLDFPRWEDCRLALQRGAWSIVAKPFQLAELAWHLDSAVRHVAAMSRSEAAA